MTSRKPRLIFPCHLLAPQEEKKEADGEEVVKEEENTKENQEVEEKQVEEQEEAKQPSPEGLQEEKKTLTEEKTRVPRAQRRPKALNIKVTLLDNTEFQCELDVREPKSGPGSSWNDHEFLWFSHDFWFQFWNCNFI